MLKSITKEVIKLFGQVDFSFFPLDRVTKSWEEWGTVVLEQWFSLELPVILLLIRIAWEAAQPITPN